MSKVLKIIPLVPSSTMGITILVYQLVRLWLKLLAEARGRLAPGYPGAGKGYDQIIIDGLGLNRAALLKFVRNNLPSFPEFELWIKAQPGVNLEQANIEKINAGVAAFEHELAFCQKIAKKVGLPADQPVPRKALIVNLYEDLDAFYRKLVPRKVRDRRRSKNAPKQSEGQAVGDPNAEKPATDANAGTNLPQAAPGTFHDGAGNTDTGAGTTPTNAAAGGDLKPGEFRLETPADKPVEQATAKV